MFDGIEDIPVHLLSRRSQATLNGILERTLKLGKTRGYELVFVHMPGCGACAAARPALRRFAKKHPNVKVREVSIAKLKLPDNVLSKMATPTYVLKKPNGRTKKIEGGLDTVLELETWIGTQL